MEELNTQYDYYDIPVIFCPQKLLRWVCKSVSDGSMVDNNGELEGQYMYTEVLDRGFVEMSVDTWEDVFEVSNFVRIVQRACGMNLYCLEEIAWRRGMISTEQLKTLAEAADNENTKTYLLSLCEGTKEIEK
jgi:glucose-1-phosphate thymidylyltransferase